MSTLRVLLAAPPSPTRASPWVHFDDGGRVVDRGQSTPDRWPAATRREAVLAAPLVRVIALALPPMSPTRLAAAAAYALEDRLATSADAPAIAVSPQRADGRVHAAVANRATVDAIAAATPRFARIVPEPALAPVGAGWTWHASGGGGGFVRTADGSAFAVGEGPAAGTLPPELAAALAQAMRSADAPRSVVVADRVDEGLLRDWTRATGIAFTRGEPWRWDAATAEAFAAAPDLLGRPAEGPSVPRRTVWQSMRPAVAVVVAALGLHVLATAGQWSWLRYQEWRDGRALVALAQGAGLGDPATPDTAYRMLARRDGELRHRAALAAPSDALPLLARAAPALAALPPAALKSAIYSDGAWTFELAKLDDTVQAALDRRLQDGGLAPLQARTSAGHRVRVTLAP